MKMHRLGWLAACFALGCSGALSPTPDGDVGSAPATSSVRDEARVGGVERECFRYDSYLAALGELTVQCHGTVDPRLYRVADDGLVTPTFASCPRDPSRLSKIKQLLSLQQRGELAPFAKECMGERFAAAQRELEESGVTSCPTWSKERVINPIGHDAIALVERALPESSAADGSAPLLVDARGVTRASLTLIESSAELAGEPLNVFDVLQENSLYSVQAPAGGQGCDSPSACAAVCARAFPGFVLGTQGPEGIVTDPIAWLTDTIYGSAAEDPYLRATYYHPMSYYGGVPGVVFGDPARAEPCGPNTTCLPELCSYYAGSHIKTRMQMSCVIPGDPDTCASYCGPPLP
jgi:hypothetical protein